MSDNGTEFTTTLGRIVWGHPLKPQDKTKDNQKVLDPQTGQPVKQWAFGVAFPKADFEAHIWPHLYAEALKGYPNGVPNTFSYKYKDGDDASPVWANGKQQKPYAEREGYPGHYVLTFSTEFQAPNCFRYENNAYTQLGPDQLKTGDFVMVGTNAKWHAGQSPGLYVNPLTVLLCYEGDALGGSYQADPTQMFGAAPQIGQMPAGARPLGSPAPGQMPPQGSMPGMGQQQPMQPQGMPGGAPMQPAQQPQMQPQGMPGNGAPNMGAPAPQMQQPQQMPPPATDFIPQQPQGMPGQQPGMAPAPGQPGMMPPPR